MTEQAKCELCGEPMPPGEEMFKYHGYSGPCPKPPLAKVSQDSELDRLRKENAALREALTLICDLASQEWEERDGSLKGAVDNQGRRMWFISQDLMDAARAALQGAKEKGDE